MSDDSTDDSTPAGEAFLEHCAVLYALEALQRRDSGEIFLRLSRHPHSRVKSFLVTRRAIELVVETLPVIAQGRPFTVDDAIEMLDEQRQALEARFPSLGVKGAW